MEVVEILTVVILMTWLVYALKTGFLEEYALASRPTTSRQTTFLLDLGWMTILVWLWLISLVVHEPVTSIIMSLQPASLGVSLMWVAYKRLANVGLSRAAVTLILLLCTLSYTTIIQAFGWEAWSGALISIVISYYITARMLLMDQLLRSTHQRHQQNGEGSNQKTT